MQGPLRRQYSITPSNSNDIKQKEQKQSPEDFLRILVEGKHIPKAKSKAFYKIHRSRNISELMAELTSVFLTGENFTVMGHKFVIGDEFVKALMYSDYYQKNNYVPKGETKMATPLVSQFMIEKQIEMKKMAENLLIMWGLLYEWIEKSNEKLKEFKIAEDKLQIPIAKFRAQVTLSNYRDKINLVCEKFSQVLVPLLKLENKLTSLLSSLKKEEKYGDKVPLQPSEEKNYDEIIARFLDEREPISLLTFNKDEKDKEKASDLIANLIVQAEKFIKDSSRMIILKNRESNLIQDSFDPGKIITHAQNYLSQVVGYIKAIRQTEDARLWNYVDTIHQQAIIESQELIPTLGQRQLLEELLIKAESTLKNVGERLRTLNSQIVADGDDKTGKKVSDPLIIRAGEIPSLPSLIQLETLSDKAYLFEEQYLPNANCLTNTLRAVDTAVMHMESLIRLTGILPELNSLIEDFSHKINELGGAQFKKLNQSAKLLTTLMKFNKYFPEIHVGFEEDVFDMVGEKNPQKKLSRAKLQHKAMEMAKKYKETHPEGILDFLREQKLINPLFQKEVRENELNFVDRFHRTLAVLELSCDYFVRQHRLACDLHGKEKGWILQQSGMNWDNKLEMKSARVEYQDADFLDLLSTPGILREFRHWNSRKEEFPELFADVPSMTRLMRSMFSDDMRSLYSLDKLDEMTKAANQRGFYNPLLKPLLAYVRAEREFGIQLASLMMEYEGNDVYLTENGEQLASNNLKDKYKALLNKAAGYHGVLDYLTAVLLPVESACASVKNLRRLLVIKKNALVNFSAPLQKSFNDDYMAWNSEKERVTKSLKNENLTDAVSCKDSVLGEEAMFIAAGQLGKLRFMTKNIPTPSRSSIVGASPQKTPDVELKISDAPPPTSLIERKTLNVSDNFDNDVPKTQLKLPDASPSMPLKEHNSDASTQEQRILESEEKKTENSTQQDLSNSVNNDSDIPMAPPMDAPPEFPVGDLNSGGRQNNSESKVLVDVKSTSPGIPPENTDLLASIRSVDKNNLRSTKLNPLKQESAPKGSGMI